MTITKFGHSCLLIEQNGTRILTDPGVWTSQQNDLTAVDIIIITHQHPDHFSINSVKALIANNPRAQIITNSRVGELLKTEGIAFQILENTQTNEINGITIEAIGNDHAVLHSSIPCIQNTGYLIADRLFFPGDSYTIPSHPVELLALPVAGPWLKLQDCIDYALAVKPNVCFPIHDGILKSPGGAHLIPPQVLEPAGIKFQILEIDKEYEF